MQRTQSVTAFHVKSRRRISLKMRSITRHDCTPPILACNSLTGYNSEDEENLLKA